MKSMQGDKVKKKPITPYQRLLDDFRLYISSVECPVVLKTMFFYKKSDLDNHDAWMMDEVYERTIAAEQLGYDVIIRADNDGLRIMYRTKPGPKPWQV